MDDVKDGEANPTPAGQRAGRGLKIALILSLTLNLLVLGIVGGSILAHGWGDDPRRVRDVGFGPYTEALSPEDRKALLQGFMKAMPDFRKEREAARADMVRLADAIRTEPFDRATVEAVMNDQAARIRDRIELGRALLLDRLEAMGPEARAALADRMEHMRLRPHD
jgi:uncharacterized membrane protein